GVSLYPELMAELDAIKRERIGGLMLRRVGPARALADVADAGRDRPHPHVAQDEREAAEQPRPLKPAARKTRTELPRRAARSCFGASACAGIGGSNKPAVLCCYRRIGVTHMAARRCPWPSGLIGLPYRVGPIRHRGKAWRGGEHQKAGGNREFYRGGRHSQISRAREKNSSSKRRIQHMTTRRQKTQTKGAGIDPMIELSSDLKRR